MRILHLQSKQHRFPLSGIPKLLPYPPEETLWKNPASAPPTTHREMDHLKPDNSQAAPQSSFDEANPLFMMQL